MSRAEQLIDAYKRGDAWQCRAADLTKECVQLQTDFASAKNKITQLECIVANAKETVTLVQVSFEAIKKEVEQFQFKLVDAKTEITKLKKNRRVCKHIRSIKGWCDTYKIKCEVLGLESNCPDLIRDNLNTGHVSEKSKNGTIRNVGKSTSIGS